MMNRVIDWIVVTIATIVLISGLTVFTVCAYGLFTHPCTRGTSGQCCSPSTPCLQMEIK